MACDNQVIGLFPIPFMRVEKLLTPELVAALTERAMRQTLVTNARSAGLSHSVVQRPAGDELLTTVAERLTPIVADFGELLFGERLTWHIQDLWLNALQTGGHQTVHNHANCFVSGVLYLTASHPSAHTVFIKSLGGQDFAFSNAHLGTSQGPFNADKWVAPAPSPGDVILFPSYLLHEVPENKGPLRLSLAFNAVPTRLDAWGYTIGFNDQKTLSS